MNTYEPNDKVTITHKLDPHNLPVPLAKAINGVVQAVLSNDSVLVKCSSGEGWKGFVRLVRPDCLVKTGKAEAKVVVKDGMPKLTKTRLRTLIALNEHKTLVNAAEVLNVSYSSVWNRLSNTENLFGKKLYDADNGGLTPAGLQVLENYTNA